MRETTRKLLTCLPCLAMNRSSIVWLIFYDVSLDFVGFRRPTEPMPFGTCKVGVMMFALMRGRFPFSHKLFDLWLKSAVGLGARFQTFKGFQGGWDCAPGEPRPETLAAREVSGLGVPRRSQQPGLSPTPGPPRMTSQGRTMSALQSCFALQRERGPFKTGRECSGVVGSSGCSDFEVVRARGLKSQRALPKSFPMKG